MNVYLTVADWITIVGLLVTIELGVVNGAIKLTNAIPDAWVPRVQAWCGILAAIGGGIITALSRMVGALLVAFVLSAFLATGSAQAQVPKLTGNIVRDIQTAKGSTDSSALTGNPSKDLIALYGKLQAVSLVDLKYALNIANKKNNLAAGQCWTAIITQIEQDQTANLDAQGQPLPTPDPHLFTDVERLSDVINSLGPNSPLMVGCGSFANQAKMNVLQLISTIMAGGAGLAALAP